MFVASYSRTMASARPKIIEAEKWVSIEEIRARKRREAEAERRRLALEVKAREEMTERGRLRREALMKIELAIKFWRENYLPERRSALKIIKEFCQANGADVAEIIGKGRARSVIQTRDACIRAVADERPDLSLLSLGRAFNRDHTTILHSLRKTWTEGKVR